MKEIGIIGSGAVAKTLGAGFLKHGYKVMIGARNAKKLADWKTNEGYGAEAGNYEEAAAFGDIIVLAVKGAAAKIALTLAGEGNLNEKTVIDATNPIADTTPINGVLKFFTPMNESLMEQLQAAFPNANFVKAFNSIGIANMVNPVFDSQPTMFICGNNEKAKQETAIILDQFGWETADFGKAESAGAIESLCMLWCIPGIAKNEWRHAFKLLKL